MFVYASLVDDTNIIFGRRKANWYICVVYWPENAAHCLRERGDKSGGPCLILFNFRRLIFNILFTDSLSFTGFKRCRFRNFEWTDITVDFLFLVKQTLSVICLYYSGQIRKLSRMREISSVVSSIYESYSGYCVRVFLKGTARVDVRFGNWIIAFVCCCMQVSACCWANFSTTLVCLHSNTQLGKIYQSNGLHSFIDKVTKLILARPWYVYTAIRS